MTKSKLFMIAICMTSLLSMEVMRDLTILKIFKSTEFSYSIVEEENLRHYGSSESDSEIPSTVFELDIDVIPIFDHNPLQLALNYKANLWHDKKCINFAQAIFIPPPERLIA